MVQSSSTYLREPDLYLFDRGEARRAYLTFGCHRLPDAATLADAASDNADPAASGSPASPAVSRWLFAVWAPRAKAVVLVGDFNAWDLDATPMTRDKHGVWSCVVSGLEDGDIYKYGITGQDGVTHLKADPFAFHAETGPATGSKVWDLDGPGGATASDPAGSADPAAAGTAAGPYRWHDEGFIAERAKRDAIHEAMSIYEVHLGSWRLEEGETYPNYRRVGDELAGYCTKMGYTHVELLPLTEHPLPASWGYQTTGYFAPTSRYGTPQDFMYFVDRLHAAGIGVILDWVPAHFPKDEFALARFDGKPLFEYEDPRKAEHAEWGTLVFDYARPQVRSFLISSAMFFFDRYHIDGIRVDAVSSMLYLDYARTEWVPNRNGGNINLEAVEFLKCLNTAILSEYPGTMTIAEESTAYPMVTYPAYDGGLGFTFKWDMGFMHDTLDYLSMDPLFRSGNHEKLTFSMMYAFSENFVLAFSHDEVVHGKKSMVDKMFGEYLQKFSTLRALLGFQFAHPGKKLTFMGSEFAQFIEWDFQKQLDWFLLTYPIHDGMKAYSAELNAFYRSHPALYEVDDSWAGFAWANVDDRDQSAIAFLRYPRGGDGSGVLIACDFTPNPVEGFTVGLPCYGELREVLNSDDARFGGSGLGNEGVIRAQRGGFCDLPYHARVTLPPLSAVYFEFTRRDEPSVKMEVQGRSALPDDLAASAPAGPVGPVVSALSDKRETSDRRHG